MWRKRLHHLATSDLQRALEACVAALEVMDRPDTALLCSVYEALARTLSSSPSAAADGPKAEELCLRAITALDRPDNKPQGAGAGGTAAVAGGGKGTGGAKGVRRTSGLLKTQKHTHDIRFAASGVDQIHRSLSLGPSHALYNVPSDPAGGPAQIFVPRLVGRHRTFWAWDPSALSGERSSSSITTMEGERTPALIAPSNKAKIGLRTNTADTIILLAPPGKGGAKKGDAASGDKTGGDSGGGAAGARRANVSELKGLVEVRASNQAARAGAAAVTGEGQPLLQVMVMVGGKVKGVASFCDTIGGKYTGFDGSGRHRGSDSEHTRGGRCPSHIFRRS